MEFSRRLPADTPGVAAGEVPEKILTITPNEGGQFAFKIDFVRDGVGGQKAGPGEATGPLEVVAQLGEYVVIRELFQKTIPTLIGWDVQLKYAIEQSVSMALQNGGSPPSGGRYAKPAMSSEAAADTPF